MPGFLFIMFCLYFVFWDGRITFHELNTLKTTQPKGILVVDLLKSDPWEQNNKLKPGSQLKILKKNGPSHSPNRKGKYNHQKNFSSAIVAVS